MSRKITRHIKALSGKGIITRNGQQISTVLYRVSVNREFTIAESAGGRTELPGHFTIQGSVTVTEGERNLMSSDSTLRLELDDGQSIDFFAGQGNPVSGEYSVISTGQSNLKLES